MTQPQAAMLPLAVLLFGAATATTAADPREDRWRDLGKALADYRQRLDAVGREHGGVRKLPPVAFFLFGMGDRRKLIYLGGVLTRLSFSPTSRIER